MKSEKRSTARGGVIEIGKKQNRIERSGGPAGSGFEIRISFGFPISAFDFGSLNPFHSSCCPRLFLRISVVIFALL
jgi:hypothetical protein